jgi:NitT/TauT family transport system ATP-binding protein
MVFQQPRLLPWRTLRENITIATGASPETAGRYLADVGLIEAADAFPERVSLGMQRRASLARALATRPSLVLMDEPLVSLDAENSARMRGLIREIFSAAGVTTLITTQDRREAVALADRLLELGETPATLIADRHSPLSASDRLQEDKVETVHREWFGVGRSKHIN